MKKLQLFHNPGAGDELHTEDELLSVLSSYGYDSVYISTKEKGWKDFGAIADLVVIAGGDGTVRKVAKKLIARGIMDTSAQIGLLPLGTANNVAQTLGIKGEIKQIIEGWEGAGLKAFDVGMVKNLNGDGYFLESFGFGIFPYLMQEMKKLDKDAYSDPQGKLQKALELLEKILAEYEPRHCKLEIDGTDHSGNLILAEVMNTRSIGPNLSIAPHADPGDGDLEVVLVSEKQKEKFLAYVSGKMNGVEEPGLFHTLRGKEIKISWEGTHVHIDDEIIKLEKGKELEIVIKPGWLKFLVPG